MTSKDTTLYLSSNDKEVKSYRSLYKTHNEQLPIKGPKMTNGKQEN